MEDLDLGNPVSSGDRLAGKKRRFSEIEQDPAFVAYYERANEGAQLVCPFKVSICSHYAAGPRYPHVPLVFPALPLPGLNSAMISATAFVHETCLMQTGRGVKYLFHPVTQVAAARSVLERS